MVNYNNKDIVVICAIPSVVELNRDQICENGSAKLIAHGKDVTKKNLLFLMVAKNDSPSV